MSSSQETCSAVPHKNAELIKAWADGAKIQVLTGLGGKEEWINVSNPNWNNLCQYRIKPEPKPDTVLYGHNDWLLANGRKNRCYGDTIKIIFDGETGKLKSVEIID